MANFINAGCYRSGCEGMATHVARNVAHHDPVTGLDLTFDQLLCGEHADETGDDVEVIELHQVMLTYRPMLKAVS